MQNITDFVEGHEPSAQALRDAKKTPLYPLPAHIENEIAWLIEAITTHGNNAYKFAVDLSKALSNKSPILHARVQQAVRNANMDFYDMPDDERRRAQKRVGNVLVLTDDWWANRTVYGAPTKPADVRKERRTVRMPDDEWEWCLQQGDASKYIRGLIAKDRSKPQII